MALTKREATKLMSEIGNWTLADDGKSISKTFNFKNYTKTFAFAEKIAALAEAEGHHPDLFITWGHTTVQAWTHALKGLTENDFIIAAKIDQLSR